MRALAVVIAGLLTTVASSAEAARVADHTDLVVDIDAPGASVCHFNDAGPVDVSGCNAAERLTLSNVQMLEPNAFAALVLHFASWQTSITVTKTAPLHSMTPSRVAQDLVAYRQGMQNRMAGTSVVLVDTPRVVAQPNGLQIIVSAIRNPSIDIVTRTLEVRARAATYRILFSVASAHATDVAALAEKALKSVAARPALTFAEDRH